MDETKQVHTRTDAHAHTRRRYRQKAGSGREDFSYMEFRSPLEARILLVHKAQMYTSLNKSCYEGTTYLLVFEFSFVGVCPFVDI